MSRFTAVLSGVDLKLLHYTLSKVKKTYTQALKRYVQYTMSYTLAFRQRRKQNKKKSEKRPTVPLFIIHLDE